jgi:dTDP-4-dehydrorhamnose reductase
MRIVILGGRGQLAGELFTMLHQDVVLASRHDLDITSNMMTGLLHGYRPDLVINCAAGRGRAQRGYACQRVGPQSPCPVLP